MTSFFSVFMAAEGVDAGWQAEIAEVNKIAALNDMNRSMIFLSGVVVIIRRINSFWHQWQSFI
jgi:hypothetical protein